MARRQDRCVEIIVKLREAEILLAQGVKVPPTETQSRKTCLQRRVHSHVSGSAAHTCQEKIPLTSSMAYPDSQKGQWSPKLCVQFLSNLCHLERGNASPRACFGTASTHRASVLLQVRTVTESF